MTERSDKMSVIGRLDEGVEAVLINPLRKQHAPDTAEHEQPPIPAPPTKERDPDSPKEERKGGAQMPVWML